MIAHHPVRNVVHEPRMFFGDLREFLGIREGIRTLCTGFQGRFNAGPNPGPPSSSVVQLPCQNRVAILIGTRRQ
jgi:hypothetical protein